METQLLNVDDASRFYPPLLANIVMEESDQPLGWAWSWD